MMTIMTAIMLEYFNNERDNSIDDDDDSRIYLELYIIGQLLHCKRAVSCNLTRECMEVPNFCLIATHSHTPTIVHCLN